MKTLTMLIFGVIICTGTLRGNELNAMNAWMFAEGKGDIFFNSSGTYGSGKLFGDYKREKASDEKADACITLNGKNAYGFVKCITQDGKNLVKKEIAVCVRLKLDKLPEGEYFTITSGLKNNFSIKLHGRKKKTWAIVKWADPETGDRYTMISGGKKRDLEPGEWLDFVFSIDGENAKIYVNGLPDMDMKCYLQKKDSSKEVIMVDQDNGIPYTGALSLTSLTFGVEQRGKSKRHWFSGSLNYLMIINSGLGREDLPLIEEIIKKSSAKKIVPVIEL
jgi:hypothetical protein